MGYVGGKISGHSGTEFKHRKAFVSRRAHDNSHRPKTPSGYSPKIERKNYNTKSSKGLKLITLISLIGSICWILYIFNDYTSNILGYTVPADSYSQQIERYNDEGRISSYHHFVHLGNRYLKVDMYKEALNRYDFAIGLNTQLTDVYKGYTLALFHYCTKEGQYCDRTLEYLDYALQMKLYAAQDINRMRQQVLHTMDESPHSPGY